MNTIYRMLVAVMLVSLPFAASAVPGAQLDEQINQLDQVVKLDKDQKQEIQKILEEASVRTEELQMEMQKLKQALGAEIVPNYNERAIRKNAEKLGELSGEMTAESALLQARIQNALTQEQRDILMERALRAQNMQQQVQ